MVLIGFVIGFIIYVSGEINDRNTSLYVGASLMILSVILYYLPDILKEIAAC